MNLNFQLTKANNVLNHPPLENTYADLILICFNH